MDSDWGFFLLHTVVKCQLNQPAESWSSVLPHVPLVVCSPGNYLRPVGIISPCQLDSAIKLFLPLFPCHILDDCLKSTAFVI